MCGIIQSRIAKGGASSRASSAQASAPSRVISTSCPHAAKLKCRIRRDTSSSSAINIFIGSLTRDIDFFSASGAETIIPSGQKGTRRKARCWCQTPVPPQNGCGQDSPSLPLHSVCHNATNCRELNRAPAKENRVKKQKRRPTLARVSSLGFGTRNACGLKRRLRQSFIAFASYSAGLSVLLPLPRERRGGLGFSGCALNCSNLPRKS